MFFFEVRKIGGGICFEGGFVIVKFVVFFRGLCGDVVSGVVYVSFSLGLEVVFVYRIGRCLLGYV